MIDDEEDFPEENNTSISWALDWYDQHNHNTINEKQLEQEIFSIISKKAQNDGYLEKQDIIKILRWTVPMRPGYFDKNSAPRVRITTQYAFDISDEQLRIHVLQFLNGIGLNMASRILTVYDPDNYTIISDATIYTLYKWGHIKEDSFKPTIRNWEIFLNIIRDIMLTHEINGIQFYKVASALYSRYFLKEDIVQHISLNSFFQ